MQCTTACFVHLPNHYVDGIHQCDEYLRVKGRDFLFGPIEVLVHGQLTLWWGMVCDITSLQVWKNKADPTMVARKIEGNGERCQGRKQMFSIFPPDRLLLKFPAPTSPRSTSSWESWPRWQSLWWIFYNQTITTIDRPLKIFLSYNESNEYENIYFLNILISNLSMR